MRRPTYGKALYRIQSDDPCRRTNELIVCNGLDPTRKWVNIADITLHLAIVLVSLGDSSTIVPDSVLTALVVEKDQKREGGCWQPPDESERPGHQSKVDTWAIGKEDGKARLKDHGLVHVYVLHTMLEDRHDTRLANDQIGPLDDNDRAEVRGLGCPFHRGA